MQSLSHFIFFLRCAAVLLSLHHSINHFPPRALLPSPAFPTPNSSAINALNQRPFPARSSPRYLPSPQALALSISTFPQAISLSFSLSVPMYPTYPHFLFFLIFQSPSTPPSPSSSPSSCAVSLAFPLHPFPRFLVIPPIPLSLLSPSHLSSHSPFLPLFSFHLTLDTGTNLPFLPLLSPEFPRPIPPIYPLSPCAV